MSEQDSKPNSDPNSSTTSSSDSDLAKSQPETIQANSGSLSPIDPGPNLTEEQQSQVMAFHASARRGPLPSAEELEQYEQAVPGLAKVIIDRSGNEQRHRHEIDIIAVTADVDEQKSSRSETKRGQWMAFVLALIFGGAAVALTLLGHPAVGGTVFTTTIVAIIASFLGKKISDGSATNSNSSSEEQQDSP